MIMERCFTVLFYNTVRTPEKMTNDHNNCISKHIDNQSSLQINQYGFPRELAVSKARKTAGFRPVYQMYSLNITYLFYPSFRCICYGSWMGFPLNNQRQWRRALFSRVLPHVSVPYAVTPNETTTSRASWVQPSCTMFDWCSTSEHCFPFVLPGLCDFMQTCSFVLLPSFRTTFAEYYELLLRKLGGHPIWYCFPLPFCVHFRDYSQAAKCCIQKPTCRAFSNCKHSLLPGTCNSIGFKKTHFSKQLLKTLFYRIRNYCILHIAVAIIILLYEGEIKAPCHSASGPRWHVGKHMHVVICFFTSFSSMVSSVLTRGRNKFFWVSL